MPVSITNEKNRGSVVENEGLFKFLQNQYSENKPIVFKDSVVVQEIDDEKQQEQEKAEPADKQRDSHQSLGDAHRLTLHEKIQLRKQKLQDEQKEAVGSKQ